MKKNYILMLAIVFAYTIAFGQKQSNSPWIFSYGNQKVSLEEFERGLLKNHNPEKDTITEGKVREYLNLYINFKLKVQDAFDQQLDTSTDFKNELLMYKKQIARPFLTDKEVTEALMKEAYDRLQYEIRASHILIRVKNFDNPADTLEAFNKLLKIKNEIEAGLSFDEAAFKYSEDPSAQMNKGDLGYFTAFQMVYPFESMAYNSPINTVSQIFKTDFGYHIVLVKDKRKSLGDIKVAHIMVSTNTNPDPSEADKSKERIDAIFEMLKNGKKTFEELVELYSEDPTSKKYKGELNWFNSTSSFPDEFKDAAFALKNNGDISKPVLTKYGWHVLKRVDLKEPESFESQKGLLTQKINRDSRSYKNTEAVYKRVKEELKVKEYPKDYNKFVSKEISKAYLDNKWKYLPKKTSSKALFSYGNQNATVADFAKYLEENQDSLVDADLEGVIGKHYEKFMLNTIMNHYEENLENYNQDYKFLLQEYREGILLFNLMEKKIWRGATEDTVGLQEYFDANRKEYMWDERLNITIFRSSKKETLQKIGNQLKDGISRDSIMRFYSKNDPMALSIQFGKFEYGENNWADSIFNMEIEKGKLNKSRFYFKENETQYLIWVEEYLPVMQKELIEALGPVSGDYQEVLEAEWLRDLKKKYPVSINEEEVKKLLTKHSS
jgi:peptidyl-prolyl cis-trans isomerase SurA